MVRRNTILHLGLVAGSSMDRLLSVSQRQVVFMILYEFLLSPELYVFELTKRLWENKLLQEHQRIRVNGFFSSLSQRDKDEVTFWLGTRFINALTNKEEARETK